MIYPWTIKVYIAALLSFLSFSTCETDFATAEELSKPFLWLLIAQGFFAGLVTGKLAEGKMMAGLKHSFILVALAVLISTGAKVFIG